MHERMHVCMHAPAWQDEYARCAIVIMNSLIRLHHLELGVLGEK